MLLVSTMLAVACGDEEQRRAGGTDDPQPAASSDAPASAFADVPVPGEDAPRLVATSLATVIYAQPSASSEKLGYLRVGETVARSKGAVTYEGCEYGWYAVRPAGFVCVGNDASLYIPHPLARALGKLPDTTKPLPYQYGFVRAIAPNYLRVPTKQEQRQYEFQLDRHLRSYRKLKDRWNVWEPGANLVPLDPTGVAIGPAPKEHPDLSENELFGGTGNEMVPWWLDGGRKIPHLSGYKAPTYAVIAGRVRRHTGLALIDSFVPGESAGFRRMAVTTDGRLVPASKLKPNTGSTWHGMPLGARSGLDLPVGFITEPNGTEVFALADEQTKSVGRLPWRATVNLSGRSRMRQGNRYVELKNGSWILSDDAAIAALPSQLPAFARGRQKWIDLSVVSQTMVAWEGATPVYVTIVATGRDGLRDPKTTHSTVRGTFTVREKHVTTTMDANEVDNKFELRDVPWVQYFKGGYALHAAYWHDDYGKPRSHGCVNMSPIDARWFFFWSDPRLPDGWHAVYESEKTGKGTIVHIHR
jgi:hypothetical protein